MGREEEAIDRSEGVETAGGGGGCDVFRLSYGS